MPELIKYLDGKDVVLDDSIICSATFSRDNIYHIKQTDKPYPHKIELAGNANGYQECEIGCNHRCLFCGYTWQRKFVSPKGYYAMTGGLFEGMADKERAIWTYSAIRHPLTSASCVRLRLMDFPSGYGTWSTSGSADGVWSTFSER